MMNTKGLRVLVIITTIFFIACKQEISDPALFLIPDGYVGEVLVVYDHPEGNDKMYDKDKRLYVIKENGVLKTKFKASYGLVHDQYFYVDKDQNRKEIFQCHAIENKQDICVYKGITSTIKSKGKEYEVSGFMLCSKDSTAYYNEFSFDALDIDVSYEKSAKN